jgi:general stress protein CsbA
MHFSQGWVQFGYRFSNDFVPFALVLVTLGIARLRVRGLVLTGLAVALVAASIIINAWGVYWGVTLGW